MEGSRQGGSTYYSEGAIKNTAAGVIDAWHYWKNALSKVIKISMSNQLQRYHVVHPKVH